MRAAPFRNVFVYLPPKAEHSLALHRAAAIAASPDCSLSVGSVIEDWPAWLRAALIGPASEAWEHDYLEENLLRLKAFASGITGGAEAERIDLLRGRPVIEIVREVLQRGYDLVVKDIDEDFAGQEFGVGNLDWHLLRKCPCPLWLVRGMPERARVIAALSPAESDAETAFNARLMAIATALASAQSKELHVVQALDFPADSRLLRHVPEEQIERAQAFYTQRSRDSLCAFLEPFGFSLSSGRVHLLEGRPEDAIPAAANELQADTLVIGTVARAGIAGHLIGNTAERVIGKLHCNLCAVKPEGWKSPITP